MNLYKLVVALSHGRDGGCDINSDRLLVSDPRVELVNVQRVHGRANRSLLFRIDLPHFETRRISERVHHTPDIRFELWIQVLQFRPRRIRKVCTTSAPLARCETVTA